MLKLDHLINELGEKINKADFLEFKNLIKKIDIEKEYKGGDKYFSIDCAFNILLLNNKNYNSLLSELLKDCGGFYQVLHFIKFENLKIYHCGGLYFLSDINL